jgi:clan AA aspartic protease
MISGAVSTEREAMVGLTVHSNSGLERELLFLVDTGFNGWISLPSDTIRELGLRWRRSGRAELGDGSELIFDTYEGSIQWGDHGCRVWVDEIDATPLIGMALLDGCELNIEAWPQGRVAILQRGSAPSPRS